MTTIAYDGKTLCTDSLVTAGSLACGEGRKIHRLTNGAVAAVCGDWHLAHDVVQWLDGNGDKPVPHESESIGVLLIELDGSAWEYGSRLRRAPACVPWTGGSGEAVAMAAMRCGKTAREAVELACQLDVYSGGPVQEWSHGDR